MVGAEESRDSKWMIVWICATIASIVAFLLLLDKSSPGPSADPIRVKIPALSSSNITLSYAGKDIQGISALFPRTTTEQRAEEECPSGIGESGQEIPVGADKTTTAHIFRLDIDGNEFCITKGKSFVIHGLRVRLVDLTGHQVCEPPVTPNADKWCPTLVEVEVALPQTDQRLIATSMLATTTGFGIAMTKTFDYLGFLKRRRPRTPGPATS